MNASSRHAIARAAAREPATRPTGIGSHSIPEPTGGLAHASKEQTIIQLSLSGAVKSYGARTILDGLDLEVAERTRIGVIGANGSGKSTLLRLLAGLEEPDAGTVARRRGLVATY